MVEPDWHGLAWTVFLSAAGFKVGKLARLIRGHRISNAGQIERFRSQLELNWQPPPKGSRH